MTTTQTITNVAFTGPAKDAHGNTVLRQLLKLAAEQRGYVVQGSVGTTTQLLVASRKDTVKAQKAASRGVTVMDYPEFITRLAKVAKITVDELTPRDGMISAWVDKDPPKGQTMKALQAPVGTSGYDKPWPEAFDVL